MADLDLFDDLPQKKQGPAAGRRQAAITSSHSATVQASGAALDDHGGSKFSVVEYGEGKERPGDLQAASAGVPEQQGSVDRQLSQNRTSSAADNVTRKSVASAAPARRHLVGEIFGDDDLLSNSAQDPSKAGLSRRKQHVMAAEEQKQRDKYAEEKEIDIGQLQSLDEPAQQDISKKETSINRFRLDEVQSLVQVAQAPKVHVSKNMAALPDLESMGLQSVKTHLAHTYGAQIDFSTLLSVLLPEEQMVEKLEEWDEDLLLTEVVSELELGKENYQKGG